MAGEQYLDLAIKSLLDYFESNLGTYITAVETAKSLDFGTIPTPDDFIPAKYDKDPQPNQLLVYADSGVPIEEEATSTDDIVTYECDIHFEYTSDADVETGKLRMREFLTAMINTLHSDRTLGGNVVMAIHTGDEIDASKINDATTRHSVTMGVAVTVHENR